MTPFDLNAQASLFRDPAAFEDFFRLLTQACQPGRLNPVLSEGKVLGLLTGPYSRLVGRREIPSRTDAGEND